VLRYVRRRTKAVVGVVLACAMLYSQLDILTSYLLNSAMPGEEGMGLLGTGQYRFEQWDELLEHLAQNPQDLLFGMGVGGYGELFFQDYIRGTHNLFFDILLESGLIGLSAMVLLLVWATSLTFDGRRLHLKDKLSAIALVIMILLMIREHSPAYLFLTSLGGFCFTIIFYAISLRTETLRDRRIPLGMRSGISSAIRRPRLATSAGAFN
jgi:O-antigen ligase